MLLKIYFFSLTVCQIASKQLPSYLQKCSRSDPDFKNCVFKSAQSAIPFLLNGDKKLGFPSLSPLKISRINLINDNSLKLTLTNLSVYGLENMVVKDFEMKLDEGKSNFNVFNKELRIVGNYVVNGRVLILPIRGDGPCQITFYNGSYNYTYLYDIEMKSGKPYEKINTELSKFHYEMQNATFNLENLFDGEPAIGARLNSFINENWKYLNEEFYPAISKSILTVYIGLTNIFVRNISEDDLFL